MTGEPLVALSEQSRLRTTINLWVLTLALYVVPGTMTSAQGSSQDSASIPDTLATITGAYTINTQMIMPNLEENLRYANSTSAICISEFHPDNLFPILEHQSLAGCTLIPEQQQPDESIYKLVCTGTNQTLGAASIILQNETINGIVNIRMGGKNMTFSQRINARPAQDNPKNCPAGKLNDN